MLIFTSARKFLVLLIAGLLACSFRSATSQDDELRKAGARAEFEIEQTAFAFRWCPAGEFAMGSAPGTEEKYGERFVPQRNVELTEGFWMMETEVTQAQYQQVVGANPSDWQSRGNQSPVEQVSWTDAVAFCEALSKLDSKNQYRLPTEAEWEYACRAGSTEYRYGEINEIAWVFENTDEGEGSSGHRPVGQLKPNDWGIHDMFGNVAEWCSDWHAPPSSLLQNPTGPMEGTTRIVRGDDCFVCATFLRSDGFCMAGSRMGLDPNTSSRTVGFRIVRVPLDKTNKDD